MQITPYSGRDGKAVERVKAGASPWPAPYTTAAVNGSVRVPGSKSLTNRELVLSALASEPSTLHGALRSRDTDLMVEALIALGAGITREGLDGNDVAVTPASISGGTSVDCGLAGTVMRFVPPVATLALGPVAFDGDEHARQRPMLALIEALRALGADVADDGRGALPFTVHGVGALPGGSVTIDASASSQFVSALLLSGARFDHGVLVRHEGGRLPSMPHIDMTVACLRARGVHVEADDEAATWHVRPGPISGAEVTIEPDLSNAAPFLAAAAVTGGSVSVPGWPERTTQVGAMLPDLLGRMGAAHSLRGGELRLSGGEVTGIDADLSDCGELAPTIAAVAAIATTSSRITGIAHLRGHETNRLAALVAEINGLGGDVTELDDGLEIRPAQLHGGLWHAYADHRMATAGAVIGLVVDGVEVDDIACTSKTMPNFPQMWASLLRGPSEVALRPGLDPAGI